MYVDSQTARLRREVMIHLARAYLADELLGTIDRIPVTMRPRNAESSRCCIFRDRAVIRARCLAALGLPLDIDDEVEPLYFYAVQALGREQPEGPLLSVFDVACSGCVPARHRVTDSCQGCVARPCTLNCPRDAIAVHNGRAVIDPEACVNCGKCVNVCPYHAIVRLPVPCEEACPVGAIVKDESGKAVIDFARCISCGRCLRACPFGAVMESSQLLDLLRALRHDTPTVAMIAPSIAGQFHGTMPQIVQALLALGFARVVEVAEGAEEVAREEAAEWRERMDHGERFMTTSCCPAYMAAVRKHLPELLPYLSSTLSPMRVTAAQVRRDTPEATTVFIGPCIAKRHEAREDANTDLVITYEELGAILVAADIDVKEQPETPLTNADIRRGRGFPTTGGVAAAVAHYASETPNAISIDGLSKKALRQLKAFACGTCPGNLVEVMACEGGCVAGAGVVAVPDRAARAVRKAAE
jgi:[FeFe] hydrogenase (group B1/B3)